MGPDELEWVDLTDFSLGIYEDLNRRDVTVKESNAPEGACTPASYGCVAAPDGGLMGGPKIVAVHELDAGLDQDNNAALGTLEGMDANEGDRTCPTPTDPSLSDIRLVDFDVAHVVEYPQLSRVDVYYSDAATAYFENRATDFFDNNMRSRTMVGALWQAHGIDTTEAAISYDSVQTRSNNLYYRASSVKTQILDPADVTSATGTELICAGCWSFYYPQSSAFRDSGGVSSSNYLYGWGQVMWGQVFDDSSATFTAYKVGVPCFLFFFTNDPNWGFLAGGEYDANSFSGIYTPSAWGFGVGAMGNVKNASYYPFVFVTDSSGTGVDTGSTAGAQAYQNKYLDLSLGVGTIHAGRLIGAAHPGIQASNDLWAYNNSGSYYKTPYSIDTYNGGFVDFHEDHKWAVYNNMRLHYTRANQTLDFESSLAAGSQVIPLSTAGMSIVTSVTSINASKLFVTTAHKGAQLIEGDVNNPNVSVLPSVESTYGLTPTPIPVNNGLAYGSKNGIMLWEGGEDSMLLSPQLHGKFWLPDGMDWDEDWQIGAHRGRMEYRHPYVYVPNGYYCDMRTRSWWKIGDTDAHKFATYAVDEDGYIWAGRHIHDDDESLTAAITDSTSPYVEQVRTTSSSLSNWPIAKIDPEEERTYWSWVGQPMLASRNRTIELREVTIVGQVNDPTDSTSALTIEILQEGATAWTKTLNGDDFGYYPTTHSLMCDVTGSNLQLSVTWAGSGGANKTFKLNRLSYGWRSAERIRPS